MPHGGIAVDKKKEFEELLEESRQLSDKASAGSTKRAYLGDFDIFDNWAREFGESSLPAKPETVQAYIAECVRRDLAVSTLARYLTSISRAHKLAKLPNPTIDQNVRDTMAGYRRDKGAAQKRARPLMYEQLVRVVQQLGTSIQGLRDAAILTIGWCCALRRSEIVALNREDIESVSEGLVVRIRRSKTDQEKKGRSIGIPFGTDKFCPVAVIRRWYTVAQITRGPLFIPTFRGSNRKMFITSKRRDKALTDRWISEIVKRSLENAGYDSDGYSGHSLRAGFCTQAATQAVPEWAIMAHTGHRSQAVMQGYIREGSLFGANPLFVVLGLVEGLVRELPALLPTKDQGNDLPGEVSLLPSEVQISE